MEYLAVILKNGGRFMTIIFRFLLFLLGGFIGVFNMCLIQVSSKSEDKYIEYELIKVRTPTKNRRAN